MDVNPDGLPMPGSTLLYQNYPNPFNPRTSIEYRVGSRENVRLKIYDVVGKEVATIIDNVMQAGTYAVSWDASAVSTGIYFCRLEADAVNGLQHYVENEKMILIK